MHQIPARPYWGTAGHISAREGPGSMKGDSTGTSSLQASLVPESQSGKGSSNPAPGSTQDHWKSNPTSESMVQTLPELWHSGPCPPPSGADHFPNALSGSGLSGASHGKGTCLEFAYTRKNGNVHVEEECSLLIFSVDSLMENNSLTWKWMASLAVLAYGIMQLEPAFRETADFYPKQSTSGFPPIFILIWRLESNQWHAWKIISSSLLFQDILFSLGSSKQQGPRNSASHSSPLWAISHGMVLKVFPGKSPARISTVFVWLQLCSFSQIFCFDRVSELDFPFTLSGFKN